MIWRAAAGATLVLLIFACGCIRYQPHELHPVQSEAKFRARNVESPGLAEFVRAQAGNAALAWPPAVLDPETLTWMAYYFQPEIEIARAKAATAAAALITARQRINPSVNVEGGYNRTPDSVSTYGITPAFTIETAGKRGYRILEAEKLAEAARLAVTEAAWKVRGQVREACIAYGFAAKRSEIYRAQLAVHSEVVAIFEKRVALGEASNPELNAARLESAAAAASLQRAEGEMIQGIAAVAAAVGLPEEALRTKLERPPSDVTFFGSPVPPASLPLLAVQKAGLLHRADIRRILIEYEAADARLRLALANQYPNITLSPAYAFQEGFPAYTLSSVIESLPLFHNNQGPIAEQVAARALVEAQFLALQAHAIGQTEAAFRLYQKSFAEWTAAGQTLQQLQLPREAAVMSAFRAGEADRLDVARSRMQTLAARQAQLEGLERLQQALGMLEDAVQAPLATEKGTTK